MIHRGHMTVCAAVKGAGRALRAACLACGTPVSDFKPVPWAELLAGSDGETPTVEVRTVLDCSRCDVAATDKFRYHRVGTPSASRA